MTKKITTTELKSGDTGTWLIQTAVCQYKIDLDGDPITVMRMPTRDARRKPGDFRILNVHAVVQWPETGGRFEYVAGDLEGNTFVARSNVIKSITKVQEIGVTHEGIEEDDDEVSSEAS